MSYLCDWCGKRIKPDDELSAATEGDDGHELRTSTYDDCGISVKVHSEHPTHYHENCMAALAVRLIKRDIPKLPKREKPG